jgi:transposase
MAAWTPPRDDRRGRLQKYSEIAVETGLMLRLAFGRPWRQTEGMLASIMRLLGLDLPVPDHTTFSRRSADLTVARAVSIARGPVNVVIDSTGLKVFGAGEWQLEKHGRKERRTWRKLHLAVDPDTGEILASELTTIEDGDASQVGPLLDQISGPIASVTADGAYDGAPVYRIIAERDPAAEVIIPPRSTAVPSDTAETAPTPRDRHLQLIQERGRLGWQKAVNYGRRSLGEVAMMRYKTVIGRRLHARTLPTQKAEASAGCKVINIMTHLGMPVSQRLV